MLTSHNVLQLFVFVLATIGTDARSAGANAAGACAPGEQALQNAVLGEARFHQKQGSLEDFGTAFSINGMRIQAGTPVSFPYGEDLSFVVQANGAEPFLRTFFKGIQMRFEAPAGVDTTAVYSNYADNLGLSRDCIAPIVGLTHKNENGAEERTDVAGTIRLDEPAQNVMIDISIVYQMLEAAHTGYIINFVAPPTEPPTPTPTKNPVDTPTEPPTPAPTKSPVKQAGDTPAPTPTPSSTPTGDDLPLDCENRVTDFYLINPALDDTDKDFMVPLPDVIDLAKFPRGKINIKAETFDCPRPDNIECVELSFSGDSRKERKAPYALYGNRKRHFFEGKPHVGENQELKACTYTDRECLHDETCKSVTLDVVESPQDGPGDMPCNECDNHYRCDVCLMEVNDGMCPLDSNQLREMNRRNCSGRYFFESGGEEFCEGDGECGTIPNSDHDTCGKYEVYKKVSCKKDRGGNLRG